MHGSNYNASGACCQASFANNPRYIVKERATLAACFAAVIRCDGLNYSTRKANHARIICNVRLQCRVMFCKLLILLDKLRITLEWIHSQGRAAEHGYSPGLSMAGNQQQQSRNQQQKETEPQGLTEQQKPDTLRSIETKQKGTSSEPAEPHKMRDNQSSKAQGCARLVRVQSSRAEPQALRAKRDRYRARPHASKRTSSSEQQAARNPAEPHGLRVQSSEPHEPHQHERPPAAVPGCHGGSGQRVGSEGVSHERTKFRCT